MPELHLLRTSLNLTQEKMANKLYISQSGYCMLETLFNRPSIDTLIEIVKLSIKHRKPLDIKKLILEYDFDPSKQN